MNDYDDEHRPMKGIVRGLMLGFVLWAMIGAAIIRCSHPVS